MNARRRDYTSPHVVVINRSVLALAPRGYGSRVAPCVPPRRWLPCVAPPAPPRRIRHPRVRRDCAAAATRRSARDPPVPRPGEAPFSGHWGGTWRAPPRPLSVVQSHPRLVCRARTTPGEPAREVHVERLGRDSTPPPRARARLRHERRQRLPSAPPRASVAAMSSMGTPGVRVSRRDRRGSGRIERHDVGLFRGSSVAGKSASSTVVASVAAGQEGTWVRTRRTSSRARGSVGTRRATPGGAPPRPSGVRRARAARDHGSVSATSATAARVQSPARPFPAPVKSFASAFRAASIRLTGLQRRLQRGRLALARSPRRVRRANLRVQRLHVGHSPRGSVWTHPGSGRRGLGARAAAARSAASTSASRASRASMRASRAARSVGEGGGALANSRTRPTTRSAASLASLSFLSSTLRALNSSPSARARERAGLQDRAKERALGAELEAVPNFRRLTLVLMRSRSAMPLPSAFSWALSRMRRKESAVWSSSASARRNAGPEEGSLERAWRRPCGTDRGVHRDVFEGELPWRRCARSPSWPWRRACARTSKRGRDGGGEGATVGRRGALRRARAAREDARRRSRARAFGEADREERPTVARCARGGRDERKLSRFKRTASMVRAGGLSC